MSTLQKLNSDTQSNFSRQNTRLICSDEFDDNREYKTN